MSETLLVTSGKGGVGKSAVSTMLGVAFAQQGKKVLLLETDCGLRNLDVINGVDDQTVYDLSDVLLGRCEPIKAILKSKLTDNLELLPAANNTSYIPEKSGLEVLIRGLSGYYDYIIVDCPAGFDSILYAVMPTVQKAIVVVAPNLISVRDGAKAADILEQGGIKQRRLVINMLPKKI